MWKGRHHGQDVAVKVLRVCLKDGFEKISRVGCLWFSRPVMCTCELTASSIEVLQRGRDMERPPSSERTATARRDDDRESICDGIGVDGQR